MDAAQVAGLLILLGVVGVLAAIVGSGIRAGPVTFPSIPSSRQKLLAVTSVAVVAGGVAWSLSQSGGGGGADTATTTFPKGGLRVILIPNHANAKLGDDIVVTSSVDDKDGGLGDSQCAMRWQDIVDRRVVWEDTTPCQGTFEEPNVSHIGLHRISVAVEAMAGAHGTGNRAVDVNVTR